MNIHCITAKTRETQQPPGCTVPDEVQRLLFVEAQETGPLHVERVPLTVTVWVVRLFPVLALGANQSKGKTPH